MNIDVTGEFPEIVGILCDNDSIFLDGAREDDVIRIAQPIAVARVNRVVESVLVEMLTE